MIGVADAVTRVRPERPPRAIFACDMRHLFISIGIAASLFGGAPLQAQTMKNEVPAISAFPTGEENVGFARYFSGRSWLAPLTASASGLPIFNVTFEPACRNNWHRHAGGQILLAVGGEGYYQERGCAARRLRAGDVVEIGPGVEHWHGAAPDSWFSHLAVECRPQPNGNTWLEPVTDEAYAAATGMRERHPSTADDRTARCRANYRTLFGGEALSGAGDDPELLAMLQRTIFGEVFATGDLSLPMRETITCVVLATLQALPQLEAHAAAALRVGVSPLELREAVYQCAPYIGFPRTLNAVTTIDAVFRRAGIELPLPAAATVGEEERLAAGRALRERLYGAVSGDEAVVRLLDGGCFGDLRTRSGLTQRQRGLLAWCVLTVLGADELLEAEARANLRLGNEAAELFAATVQCLPYAGYPAALRALAALRRCTDGPMR